MAVEKSEQERLNQLRSQVESDPENMDASISLAEMYSDLGWISESEEIYSLLAKKHPENYSIQLAYGNICYNKNLRKEALKIFYNLTHMKPDRVEGWNNLGIIQMESKDIDGARDSFKKVLELEPKNHGALLNLGNYYNISGDSKKALECFKKATEVRPDFRDGWFNYGNSLLSEKKYDEAIKVYERSLKYDPLFMSALKNIGYAHEMRGEFEKSVEYYLKALEQDRTDSTLYSNIANVYKQMDKLDESEDYYQKSVKVAPRESSGWAGLRQISILEGNLDTYMKSTLAILHRLSSDEVAESCRVLRLCEWQKRVSRIIKAADKLKMVGQKIDTERLLDHLYKNGNDKRCKNLFKKLKNSDNLNDESKRAIMQYSLSYSNWQDSLDIYNSIKTKEYYDKVQYTLALFDNNKGNASTKMVDELFSKHKNESCSWFLKSAYLLLFKHQKNEAEEMLKNALKRGFSLVHLIKKYPEIEEIYKKIVEKA